MMTTTPQQLGRTSELHQHDNLDIFCLRCITNDLFKPNFRSDLALLTCFHLRHLAEHRASALGHGATWEDTWLDVLDLDALAADWTSTDTLRRAIVRRAQATVQDFLMYRKVTSTSRHSNAVLKVLRAIEQRTLAQLDELGLDRRNHTAVQPRN
jgi:hypothetical protein